jgi:hypothetical protein
MGKEGIFIFGAIAAGIAIAGSLFLLYPDMMFQGTSLQSQGGVTTEEPVFVDETGTAGAGSNSTNSTANTTTGAPATTTAPPY